MDVHVLEERLAVRLVKRDAVDQQAQAADVVALHARAADGNLGVLRALGRLHHHARLVAQEVFQVRAAPAPDVVRADDAGGSGLALQAFPRRGEVR